MEKALKMDGQFFEGRTIKVKRATAQNHNKKDDKNVDKHAARQRKDQLTVFIGGLPFGTDLVALKKDFEECGEVESIRTLNDDAGKFKGTAFVVYKSSEAVTKALEWHGADYGGRKIIVRRAGEGVKGDGKGKGAGWNTDHDRTVFVGSLSQELGAEQLESRTSQSAAPSTRSGLSRTARASPRVLPSSSSSRPAARSERWSGTASTMETARSRCRWRRSRIRATARASHRSCACAARTSLAHVAAAESGGRRSRRVHSACAPAWTPEPLPRAAPRRSAATAAAAGRSALAEGFACSAAGEARGPRRAPSAQVQSQCKQKSGLARCRCTAHGIQLRTDPRGICVSDCPR
ncbi:unnamed protein product [Prorocentrum cordatum]|uniref:RRM domain-containing protein n=1 Tax=Prorocentrum cordatum TaxID=2364126 RepID=A0ABN9SN53_9DINO|nr:unnamed protein product [Polarella glacialis]